MRIFAAILYIVENPDCTAVILTGGPTKSKTDTEHKQTEAESMRSFFIGHMKPIGIKNYFIGERKVSEVFLPSPFEQQSILLIEENRSYDTAENINNSIPIITQLERYLNVRLRPVFLLNRFHWKRIKKILRHQGTILRNRGFRAAEDILGDPPTKRSKKAELQETVYTIITHLHGEAFISALARQLRK